MLLHHNVFIQKDPNYGSKRRESFHSRLKKSGNKYFKLSKFSFWRPGNDGEIDATPKPCAGSGSGRATATLQYKGENVTFK